MTFACGVDDVPSWCFVQVIPDLFVTAESFDMRYWESLFYHMHEMVELSRSLHTFAKAITGNS
jgi:hypothetical protein